MGSFGEDLRMERTSRGIALEHITAVTKISQHHLLALEQERFRQLPGGILNKGIVRGYAGAVGLDQQDWTDRFLRASTDSGMIIENPDWTSFASNVGKRAHSAARGELNSGLRWMGVLVMIMAVGAAAFLMVRYYGLRAGWWSTFLPPNPFTPRLYSTYIAVRSWVAHLLA